MPLESPQMRFKRRKSSAARVGRWKWRSWLRTKIGVFVLMTKNLGNLSRVRCREASDRGRRCGVRRACAAVRHRRCASSWMNPARAFRSALGAAVALRPHTRRSGSASMCRRRPIANTTLARRRGSCDDDMNRTRADAAPGPRISSTFSRRPTIDALDVIDRGVDLPTVVADAKSRTRALQQLHLIAV